MVKQRILVVDDNEQVLEMARDALEKAGYEVLTAGNGVEADSYIFSKNRPDLMILEVMQPMLDGREKARLLREKGSSGPIPVLLISSKSEDELRLLAIEAGADGYIRKPFTSAGIVAGVREFMARISR